MGIETIEISGVHRDYVSIQYQNGDRISIPVDQIQMLSKYVASDGKTPKINKLNDGRFQRTKQKVQTQVEDIADDLIKLYAERSQLEGFAYSQDDENQEAFEQDFPYIETDDQLRSIEEIKKIWNRIVRWTDCWLETSVLGKQRSLCEQLLRQ